MTDRIKKILKSKDLSPSQLADKINVQRSGVSHILSGRNKPSLDFVMKILSSYPDINADWLLFGKGKMIREKDIAEPAHSMTEETTLKKSTKKQERIDPESVIRDEEKVYYGTKSEIEKVIVFYRDKTFSVYHQER